MGTMRVNMGLSSLGAQTSLLNTFGGMDTELDAPFLIKQVQYNIHVNELAAGEHVIVGLSQGDVSISEITSALEQELTDPFDIGEAGLALKKIGIFWETLRSFSAQMDINNEQIKIGGGKGIPIAEGKGVNVFVYNPAIGALSAAGQGCVGLVTIKGVWLSD